MGGLPWVTLAEQADDGFGPFGVRAEQLGQRKIGLGLPARAVVGGRYPDAGGVDLVRRECRAPRNELLG